jgi:hypothetical protein
LHSFQIEDQQPDPRFDPNGYFQSLLGSVVSLGKLNEMMEFLKGNCRKGVLAMIQHVIKDVETKYKERF